MRRRSAPFLVVIGVLIGILVMALFAPEHATDSPAGPGEVPGVSTTADVDRSEARP